MGELCSVVKRGKLEGKGYWRKTCLSAATAQVFEVRTVGLIGLLECLTEHHITYQMLTDQVVLSMEQFPLLTHTPYHIQNTLLAIMESFS